MTLAALTRRPLPAVRGLAVLVCGLVIHGQCAAAQSDMCSEALSRAAHETGVPADVLVTIARMESGRGGASGHAAWPWALNIAGVGYWPQTRQEALDLIAQARENGENSIDLGCFQINWRWHGASFADPSDLLDPLRNARYAAQFLTMLYRETGDWTRAAGAYHSRTETHAAPYRARFAALRDLPAPPVTTRVSLTTYPLLQGEGPRGALGSLVPLSGG